MLPAAPLLRTLFLATRVICSRRQLLAFDHLIHLATATFYGGGLLARWTRTFVAFSDAPMGIRRSATTKDFITNCSTQRNFIQAGFSFSRQNGLLAARATLHLVHG